MTGVGGLGLLMYLLVLVDNGYCDKDNADLVSSYKFTGTDTKEQNKQNRPEESPQLLTIEQQLLHDITSKRFNSQSFFPARGKKAGDIPVQLRNGFEMMGFHGARGKRSLNSGELPYLLSYDNDYPVLRRLFKSSMHSYQPSFGQSKRLNAVSFFGARGKRPTASENSIYTVPIGQRTREYQSKDSTRPDYTGIDQVLKRQPPPGFYGIRG